MINKLPRSVVDLYTHWPYWFSGIFLVLIAIAMTILIYKHGMRCFQKYKNRDFKKEGLYWLKVFTLYELIQGLMVTLKFMFNRNFTIYFPEEQTPFSHRLRGLVVLRRYPAPPGGRTDPNTGKRTFKGEERCIGCKLCEASCPPQAITLETEERPDGSRRTTRFDIDVFKCINCGFCQEACPVDSIVCIPDANYSIEKRGDNIMPKSTLLALGEKFEDKIANSIEKDSEVV
jgi:NADH-quinone oxidoreductase subunit I